MSFKRNATVVVRSVVLGRLQSVSYGYPDDEVADEDNTSWWDMGSAISNAVSMDNLGVLTLALALLNTIAWAKDVDSKEWEKLAAVERSLLDFLNTCNNTKTVSIAGDFVDVKDRSNG